MIMYLIHSQKLHSFYLCIFWAVLDLRCFAQAFSNCGKRGLLFVVVREPLIITVTPLVAEYRLQAHGLHQLWPRGSVVGVCGPQCAQTYIVVPHSPSSCGLRALECWLRGTQVQLLHSMWNLPRPGIQPVSPVVAGRFLSTAPLRKFCIKQVLILR